MRPHLSMIGHVTDLASWLDSTDRAVGSSCCAAMASAASEPLRDHARRAGGGVHLVSPVTLE